MQRRQAIVLATGALALCQVQANEAPLPTAAPVEVNELLPGARLSGQGRLRFLGMAIYDARLWVGAGFEPQAYEAHPFALELHYARALKGPLIAERSLKEMQRIANIGPEQAARWLEFMKASFPDVAESDRITGAHLPGQGARFWHNGARMRELRDADFARSFFGIWLSPRTSEPALRAALVGARAS